MKTENDLSSKQIKTKLLKLTMESTQSIAKLRTAIGKTYPKTEILKLVEQTVQSVRREENFKHELYVLARTEEQERLARKNFERVRKWAKTQEFLSASLIQRRFKLGYPTAATLLELLKEKKVIKRSKENVFWKVIK